MENIKSLNLIVDYLKESKGLTQEQIASAAGYSDQTITQVLSKGAVSARLLMTVKKTFGIEIINNSVVDASSSIETSDSFISKRRRGKSISNEESDGIEFVPIAAQAGYLKNLVDRSSTPMKLEKILIPGFPFRGPNYRYFEVAGDSMMPSLEEGFHVLAERCEPEYWLQQANFYIYVIVTDDQIMIKRVFWKTPFEWVIISDNEEFYPQFVLPVERVKELWKVKRKIDWKMSPAKKFEIKV